MIFDFSMLDALRLSSIKRCGIIEMYRDQSVAEHSYNVAMLCMEIMNQMNPADVEFGMKQNIIEWALVHDLTEVVTGDIPTPFKEAISEDIKRYEEVCFPKISVHKKSLSELELTIVKIADLLDAFQFITKYCADSRVSDIVSEIHEKLTACEESLPSKFREAVHLVSNQVISDVIDNSLNFSE